MTDRYVTGVDVGGTFTDFFCFDTLSGDYRTFKVSSHRGDEARGFLTGLNAVGAVGQISSIVHGTTTGTNALLERKLARTGIITTRGFRDALEMRRRDRPRTWGLWDNFVPVVERDMRIEVTERTLASGAIATPLDISEVRAAASDLVDRGAEALAIVFINAYANPTNEQAALAAARSVWPNAFVAASSDILPEIREFERTSTTVLNAALQPIVGRYLARLETALEDQDFEGTFHIVQSNGGAMSTRLARELPVRTALSGPAAGVMAARAIAKAANAPNVITGDLGGTSFDVAMICDGKISHAAQCTIDFGLVIRTPMIEITTIGAGGGSIARVDSSGMLQVGPQSAGSVPGPACYGAGNEEPTLTDANLVLGRINAAQPIGSGPSLDIEAAKQSIRMFVADKLGISTMAAAEAIVRVANAHMAGAIRLVSIERGHDPGEFSFMPFGGGGALHAGQLIADIGLHSAIVPRLPGITSALGCIIADFRHDQVQTLNTLLDDLDADALRARMRKSGQEIAAIVAANGVAQGDIATTFELDMQYAGQTHTIAVPIDAGGEGENIRADVIQAAFNSSYLGHFNRLLDNAPVRIVSLRTIATGKRQGFDLASLAPPADAILAGAARGTREIWFNGGWQPAAVYSRLELPVGAKINGPAVLEQPDATILIDPGLTGTVDEFGNVILART